MGSRANRYAANQRACAGNALALPEGFAQTACMFTQTKTRFLVLLFSVSFINLFAFGQQPSSSFPETASKLAVSGKGRVKIAFVLTEGAVMIDYAGPWEVFQDTMVTSRGGSMEDQHVFDLYTVSDNTKLIRTSGGLGVVPDYTFDNAPQPNIVVVPAQMGHSQKMMDWLRTRAKHSDIVMSICTGAFTLGEAGLLNGKSATTHHGSYVSFQHEFPAVNLVKNMRYVQSDPVVFTAGGLSSGIDLALHIVDLYFGREVATDTARNMEYEGKGWMGDGSAMNWTAVKKSYPSDHLTKGVLGNWEGDLITSGGTFRVAVHIWLDTSGALTGAVDDMDRDIHGVPISGATLKNAALHFETGGGSFDGTLTTDESMVEGAWTQHRVSTQLRLERVHEQKKD